MYLVSAQERVYHLRTGKITERVKQSTVNASRGVVLAELVRE